MKTIFKYPITTSKELKLPSGAEMLSVQLQNGGIPTLWALIDTDQPQVTYHLKIAYTGEQLDSSINPKDYVGTLQMTYGTVLHFFLSENA